MTTRATPGLPDAAALSLGTEDQFVSHLGAIYEHSPWVAARAWLRRPFADREALAAAMAQVLRDASRDEQLVLIRAHPELTGRAGVRSDLTAQSSREQLGAGLDQCSPQEFAALTDLNQRYQQRFGFPFVIAVAGLSRSDIIEQMQQRLLHSADQEFGTALEQINRIARIRLGQAVAG